MPLSGRGNAASSTRYREREWKRSHGAIACAECRRSVFLSLPSLIVTEPATFLRCRLKLKCDKSVPCASCTRRGCASICPNGAYSHSPLGLSDPSRQSAHLPRVSYCLYFDCGYLIYLHACTHWMPVGSLVTGQGTRYAYHTQSLHAMPSLPITYNSSFVLADTDRLHNKITGMSARIRQLEDALAVSHSVSSSDTHPLLQRDLLQIKSIIDLHSAIEQEANENEGSGEHDENRILDTFGTLALRDDGASTFYGRSAGHEVRILL